MFSMVLVMLLSSQYRHNFSGAASTALPVEDQPDHLPPLSVRPLSVPLMNHASVEHPQLDAYFNDLLSFPEESPGDCSLDLTCLEEIPPFEPSEPQYFMPAVARLPFPQHLQYAKGTIRPNHRSQSRQDEDVRQAYDDWKTHYLIEVSPPDSAEGPLYRVSFGSTAPQRTVSEGQGYGMIIMAMMAGYEPEAQQFFDGLWRFSRQHPSQKDLNLMAWEVPEPPGGASSAFDGDVDMAFALLLADQQWGSDGRINYHAEAIDYITAIFDSTIGPGSSLPLLGDWVDPDGDEYNQYTTRSSDFMPLNFRAFNQKMKQELGHYFPQGESDLEIPQLALQIGTLWFDVLHAGQAAVTSVQHKVSSLTGLIPDFLVSSIDAKGISPAAGHFLEGPNDGAYSYNAARVPWRIGTDALLSGDPVSMQQTRKLANWIATASKGDPRQIRGGYHLDGTPLGNRFTTAFAAPFGVALMTTPKHQQLLNKLYDVVYSARSDYYEDTVSLLSLLVMTGNFWSPCSGRCDE